MNGHCLNRLASSTLSDDRQEPPAKEATWRILSPQGRLSRDCHVLGKSLREEAKQLAERLMRKRQEKRLQPGSHKQGCSVYFCSRQPSFP